MVQVSTFLASCPWSAAHPELPIQNFQTLNPGFLGDWGYSHKFYTKLADSRVSTSARLALLMQNHTCRQAPSAHYSRCSLIQRFCETLLTLLKQNHTPRQASSAHHSRCSLIQCSQQTLLTQNHSQTGGICPSLVFACSFSAHGTLNYPNYPQNIFKLY